MPTGKSLQETYAPQGRCFGCGPANPKGLRIRSFALSEDPKAEVVADWTPESHHEAFEGVLNGGIIGTLLDCHMNWTASYHFLRSRGLDQAPPTVTAEYQVKLRRPTPSQGPVHLSAHVVESGPDRVRVEGTLTAGNTVTALGSGTFVAVEPGHPAFHRW